MGRIILTPSGPRHPLEARAPAVRNEATVIILLAVHSSSTPKSRFSPTPGLHMSESPHNPLPNLWLSVRRPSGPGRPGENVKRVEKLQQKSTFFFGTFFVHKLVPRHPRDVPDTSLGLFRASTSGATLAKSPNGSLSDATTEAAIPTRSLEPTTTHKPRQLWVHH